MRHLVILLGVAACDPAPVTIDQMPCPAAGTQLTYANFGAEFFASYCNRCHTRSQHGAPDTFHFDTLDQVHTHLARIFVRAAGPNTTMPPGPDDPPMADRDQLAEWLACGSP